MYAGLTLVLLALPIAAGLVVARVRSARGWLIVGAAAGALLPIYFMFQRVV